MHLLRMATRISCVSEVLLDTPWKASTASSRVNTQSMDRAYATRTNWLINVESSDSVSTIHWLHCSESACTRSHVRRHRAPHRSSTAKTCPASLAGDQRLVHQVRGFAACDINDLYLDTVVEPQYGQILQHSRYRIQPASISVVSALTHLSARSL